jgi:hypothetical protein
MWGGDDGGMRGLRVMAGWKGRSVGGVGGSVDGVFGECDMRCDLGIWGLCFLYYGYCSELRCPILMCVESVSV